MTEITKCELLVMEVIWRNQESGAEEMSLPMVMEKLKKNYGSTWKPQTVSTFLSRLVKKGYLDMYRVSRSFLYHPVVDEQTYLDHHMEEEANTLFQGNYQRYKEVVAKFCDAKK